VFSDVVDGRSGASCYWNDADRQRRRRKLGHAVFVDCSTIGPTVRGSSGRGSPSSDARCSSAVTGVLAPRQQDGHTDDPGRTANDLTSSEPEPMLEKMGRVIAVRGEIGQGQIVKLINNAVRTPRRSRGQACAYGKRSSGSGPRSLAL